MSKGNPQGLVNHLLELNWRSNIGTDSLHEDFYIYMLKQKAVFCSGLSLWGQQGSCGKCYGVIKNKTGKSCPWRKPPYFIIILFQIFFPLFSIVSRKSLLSSHCAYAAQNASKPNHEFRLSPSLSMIFLAIFFSMHFFLNIIAYLGRIIAWLIFKSE